MAKKRGVMIEMAAKISRIELPGGMAKNPLTSPIDVTISNDGNQWIITNDRYTVRCWGNTLEKALISLAEDLEMLKKAYYLEKNDKLTIDAIDLKKNLAEIFG